MQEHNYNNFGSQKDFILRIIKSCEYYDLGETKSLEVIEKIMKRKLSVKTFYNFKKKLYVKSKIYETKLNYGDWVSRDHIIKSYLLFRSENDMIEQFRVDRLICTAFPDIPKDYRDKMKDIGQREIDLILSNYNKLKNDVLLQDKKELELRSIPKNATIKKEFIKCGNKVCGKCPHGPYYYAYWKDKDSKNLKKVYVGGELPSEFTALTMKN